MRYGETKLMIDQKKLEKLKNEKEKLQKEFEKLNEKIKEIKDYASEEYIRTQREIHHINERLDQIDTIFRLYHQYNETKRLLQEEPEQEELKELAYEELQRLSKEISAKIEELEKNKLRIDSFVIEIRAGAGGEEAALFARDLFRMYSQFLADIGATIETTDVSYSDRGGYKFIEAYVKGPNVYRWFKYESGVHRVQRVPITESSGRVHTSTVSVAILPEYDEDVKIEINPNEIEITPIKASGPGGQHVNKNLTAVRIKHIPTGLIVTSQRYKSQRQNKEMALKILKMKLQQAEREKRLSQISDLRRSQIGTMDRSEKIRTYNFPQNRVTDHRIKKSWYNLQDILDGKIKDMLETIINELDAQQEDNSK